MVINAFLPTSQLSFQIPSLSTSGRDTRINRPNSHSEPVSLNGPASCPQHALLSSSPFQRSRSLGSSLPKAVPLFASENIKSKYQGIAVVMSIRKQTLDEGVAKQGIPKTSPNLENTVVVYLPSKCFPNSSRQQLFVDSSQCATYYSGH